MVYYDGYGYNFYYGTYGYYDYSVNPPEINGAAKVVIFIVVCGNVCIFGIVAWVFLSIGGYCDCCEDTPEVRRGRLAQNGQAAQ